MTALQIISICVLGLGVLVAIGFAIAFAVESSKKEKVSERKVEKYSEIDDSEINEIDLEAMLAKLEEASNDSNKKEVKEEPKAFVTEEKNYDEDKLFEEIKLEILRDAQKVAQAEAEETLKEEKKEEPKLEEVKVEEVKEEPKTLVAEEKKEEPSVVVVEEKIEETPVVEVKEESKTEEVKPEEVKVEEVKEEPKQEEVKVEEKIEEVINPEVVEQVEEVQVEEAQEEPKQVETEPVVVIVDNTAEKSGPEFDYRIRIEKIKESQTRIDRDLEKTTRAILKYERTIRRKDRNQKMLDRRALELTNLNLLMYSVTDIKNVDAEKKTRQEELTAHISELKASIQDADNYLEANKEKHENNLKLRDYLAHEKTRYAEELKELEALIAAGKYFDDNSGDDGDKA